MLIHLIHPQSKISYRFYQCMEVMWSVFVCVWVCAYMGKLDN